MRLGALVKSGCLIAGAAALGSLWSDPTQMNHPECERTDHNRYGREAHVEQKTYARTSHHQNC